jgi:hypothetical protein
MVSSLQWGVVSPHTTPNMGDHHLSAICDCLLNTFTVTQHSLRPLHHPQPKVADDDDDQWRYSPDRALASLTGFMIVYNKMWGYQLHDRPVLDTLIHPSETSSRDATRDSRGEAGKHE